MVSCCAESPESKFDLVIGVSICNIVSVGDYSSPAPCLSIIFAALRFVDRLEGLKI